MLRNLSVRPFVSALFTGSILLSTTMSMTGCGRTEETAEDSSELDAYGSAYKSFTPAIEVGTIRYCHDGDTCRVRIKGTYRDISIRLAGIDAPEVSGGANGMGQPLGREARDYLSNMVKGKEVRLAKIETDPYGRTIAEVYVGKTLVNLKIVETGMAEAYRWATWKINKRAYAEAEKAAKKQRKGVWSLDQYESPGAFRHRE